VAEHFGEVGPDDTFEALVLVDLATNRRTEIRREPSWEAGHGAGHLLSDGDVIGLLTVSASSSLVRWSTDTGTQAWTVGVTLDARVGLAVAPDGTIATTRHRYDEALAPVIVVTTHDPATGDARTTTTVEVVDPEGTLDTGLSCEDWLTPTVLLCSRAGGAPMALDLDGSWRLLPGPPGARITAADLG
jgi:hypothetical protein